AVSRTLQSARGGTERVGGSGDERYALPVVRRGGIAPRHRVRQRFDSAVGTRYRAAARIRGARRGGRAGPPHRATTAHGIDAVGGGGCDVWRGGFVCNPCRHTDSAASFCLCAG